MWECPDRRPSGPGILGKSQTGTGTAGFGPVQTGSQSVPDRTSPTLICMLTVCQPVIYYRPFSTCGPMVGNIVPLKVCWPMIYYTPFSASGLTVSNINLLAACWPVIYYTPFSVGGPMVCNICMLTACWPVIYYRPFQRLGRRSVV